MLPGSTPRFSGCPGVSVVVVDVDGGAMVIAFCISTLGISIMELGDVTFLGGAWWGVTWSTTRRLHEVVFLFPLDATQPEICNFHHTFTSQENILWLQVSVNTSKRPMNNFLGVEVLK